MSVRIVTPTKRITRHNRVRATVTGTPARPRLVVRRSLKHIYAQVIDDTIGMTLVAATDREITSPEKSDQVGRKVHLAFQVGELLAKKAIDKKIDQVVFDRGGYRYHGRVKSLAEGARAGKLAF